MATPQTDTPLSTEDRAALLDAVNDFAKKALTPRVQHPELTLSPENITEIDASALKAGILPTRGEPGAALWELPVPAQVTLAMLRILARVSPGLAHRFHLRALSARTASLLEVETDLPWVIAEGPAGLGKGALAKVLRGREVDEELNGLIFPSTSVATLAPSFGAFSKVLTPVVDRVLQFRGRLPAFVDVKPENNSHGLAESPLTHVTFLNPVEVIQHDASAAILIAHLGADGIAKVAIALGAVEGALARAEAYAAERRQGGAQIIDHAAIRLMLGETRGAIAAASALVKSVKALPDNVNGLDAIFALRLAAHPMLCAAANQCLQVFGGYGYMQDFGQEKVVRDCNTLRILGGGPNELKLHLAEGGVGE